LSLPYALGRKGRVSRALRSILISLIKWAQIAIKVFRFGDVYALSERYIGVREVESFYLRRALLSRKESLISFGTVLLELIRASSQV
jgi:hypothetical protein